MRGGKKTIKGNKKIMIGAATGLLSSSSVPDQCCSFHHYQVGPCFRTQEGDDVFSLAEGGSPGDHTSTDHG